MGPAAGLFQPGQSRRPGNKCPSGHPTAPRCLHLCFRRACLYSLFPPQDLHRPPSRPAGQSVFGRSKSARLGSVFWKMEKARPSRAEGSTGAQAPAEEQFTDEVIRRAALSTGKTTPSPASLKLAEETTPGGLEGQGPKTPGPETEFGRVGRAPYGRRGQAGAGPERRQRGGT